MSKGEGGGLARRMVERNDDEDKETESTVCTVLYDATLYYILHYKILSDAALPRI